MSKLNDTPCFCRDDRQLAGGISVTKLLEGRRILVLEDEFLIAMDVEQICRDHGASQVLIARTLEEAEAAAANSVFDAAIIDIMLGNDSTLEFAASLRERRIPFAFASGYSDLDEIASAFPEIRIIGKPYSGDDLVQAIAAAGRRP
jgi:DNA-binding response OmpR family regulator